MDLQQWKEVFHPRHPCLQLPVGSCVKLAVQIAFPIYYIWLQAVRQVEQQLVLESLIKFMNIIEGRGVDQESLDGPKTWSLQDLEGFFQVRNSCLLGYCPKCMILWLKVVCRPVMLCMQNRALMCVSGRASLMDCLILHEYLCACQTSILETCLNAS